MVTITGTDDDTLGLVVAPRVLMVTEPPPATNADAPYTVRLATAPAGNVAVAVTIGYPVVATVGPVGSPGSRTLTFGPNTWNTPQAVTAPLDSNFANTYTILTHMVSGYGTVTPAVNVRMDVVGTTWAIKVDPPALDILEDGPACTYTVATLTSLCYALTVNVTSTNSAVNAVPTVLTFDASNSATQ